MNKCAIADKGNKRLYSYVSLYAILFADQGERIYQRSFRMERRATAQKIHPKLQKNFKT